MERAGAKRQTFHGYRRFVQIKGRLDALLEVWKLGGWEVWLWGAAKRRAAVAVSGEAAERPMEPEAVRASPCVFAVPIFPDTIEHERGEERCGIMHDS